MTFSYPGLPSSASIVGVSGSPSPVSKTASLVDHVLHRLGRTEPAQHIRLAQLDPVSLLRGESENPTFKRAVELMQGADGVVIATPIFKASFSGLLKSFLDVLPQFGLAGKVVLPLATGGSPAHVLALDYALRPVLQSMGARHIVQAVFVSATHLQTEEDVLKIAPESAALLDEAILHFAYALRGAVNSPELLGHPRPIRSVSNPILSTATI
jgi:FMN reductase